MLLLDANKTKEQESNNRSTSVFILEVLRHVKAQHSHLSHMN